MNINFQSASTLFACFSESPLCVCFFFFLLYFRIMKLKWKQPSPRFPSPCLCSGLRRQDLRACERLFGGALSHWAGSLSSDTQHLPVPVGQIHKSEWDVMRVANHISYEFIFVWFINVQTAGNSAPLYKMIFQIKKLFFSLTLYSVVCNVHHETDDEPKLMHEY